MMKIYLDLSNAFIWVFVVVGYVVGFDKYRIIKQNKKNKKIEFQMAGIEKSDWFDDSNSEETFIFSLKWEALPIN